MTMRPMFWSTPASCCEMCDNTVHPAHSQHNQLNQKSKSTSAGTVTNSFSVSRQCSQNIASVEVPGSSTGYNRTYCKQSLRSKWLRITSNTVIILQSEQSSESDGNWRHMDTNLGSQHSITEVQATSGDLAKPDFQTQALPQL